MFLSGGAPLGLQYTSSQDFMSPLGPGLSQQKHPRGPTPTDEGVGEGSLAHCGKGKGKPFTPLLPYIQPGLSKSVWQAARSGAKAVSDRLVTGKLPSLAQELCLVTMVTFTTSSLTKAQGICYLKPSPYTTHGFRKDAYQWPGPLDLIFLPLPGWPPIPKMRRKA